MIEQRKRQKTGKIARSITKGWRRTMMRKQVRDFIHRQLIRVIRWRIT